MTSYARINIRNPTCCSFYLNFALIEWIMSIAYFLMKVSFLFCDLKVTMKAFPSFAKWEIITQNLFPYIMRDGNKM